jgi:plastocyanin
MRLTRLAVAATAVAAVAVGPATAGAAAPKTVSGTVGPGFSINLTLAGKKVKALKAGVPYRFVINDRSAIHDFHLSGPGVNKQITGVPFTGTRAVVLALKKGTYRYVCDPHSTLMKGSFKVT